LQDGRAEPAADPEAGARAEQKIPFKRSEDSSTFVVLRIAGALAITVLVGFAALYAMKRFLPSFYRPVLSDHARIHVREVRRLTPKTLLFLVEVDGTALLLAQSGEGVTLLHQFPSPPPRADDERRA